MTASEIFKGVFLHDEIPMTDLPACILTELLDSKEDKLQAFWYRKKNDHLTAIYDMLSEASVPPRKDVERCVRHHPGTWNPLPYPRSPEQSDASHLEQSAAVFAGVRAIDKYAQQFDPAAATATWNVITHGAPGSGKTHVTLYNAFYLISMGLNTMATALMAS